MKSFQENWLKVEDAKWANKKKCLQRWNRFPAATLIYS
jgi:hypothetical protein